MKAVHLHLAFAIISVACLLVLLVTAYERSNASRINRMIAEPGLSSDGEPVEATLGRGIALARAGDGKGAERAYQLVLQHGSPDLQRRARYNLANLQLRHALRTGEDDTGFLARVEVAKLHYREVLAEQPEHWDARYNLERALWLVPENELQQSSEERTRPAVRIPKAIMVDPGDLP